MSAFDKVKGAVQGVAMAAMKKAVEHAPEPRLVPRQQRVQRIGRGALGHSLGEVQFEDQRRGPPLPHPVDLLAKSRLYHAVQLKRPLWR